MNLRARDLFLAAGLLVSGSSLPAAEASSGPSGFRPCPFDTCLAGGEKPGCMGLAFAFQFEGRAIKFCCKGCREDFKKDHARFMAKLAEADKQTSPTADSKPGQPRPQEHKH